jgi:hypothetical protein
MARESVVLNVYDMCSLNQYASHVGVGIFHSGVQVYGVEYGYGGHPLGISGVFEIDPRDEEALGEENFKFRESIVLGYTDFLEDNVRDLVNSMGDHYKGDQYHLLHKNCNHFCDGLTKTLCGKGIPNWVNRLAYVSSCIPFLERCLPKEFLTPNILEDQVRDQGKFCFSQSQSSRQPSISTNSSTGGTSSSHRPVPESRLRTGSDHDSDLRKATSSQW